MPLNLHSPTLQNCHTLTNDPEMKLQEWPVPFSNKKLYSNGTLDSYRPYIHCTLRTKFYQQLHRLSQPSKWVKLISKCFVWLNMMTNVLEWTTICLECQQCKIYHHTFISPDAQFIHTLISSICYYWHISDTITYWLLSVDFPND